MVNLHVNDFLHVGGDPKWLNGLECAPQKLKNLGELNKILAHRPWLITKEHIEVSIVYYAVSPFFFKTVTFLWVKQILLKLYIFDSRVIPQIHILHSTFLLQLILTKTVNISERFTVAQCMPSNYFLFTRGRQVLTSRHEAEVAWRVENITNTDEYSGESMGK